MIFYCLYDNALDFLKQRKICYISEIEISFLGGVRKLGNIVFLLCAEFNFCEIIVRKIKMIL